MMKMNVNVENCLDEYLIKYIFVIKYIISH